MTVLLKFVYYLLIKLPVKYFSVFSFAKLKKWGEEKKGNKEEWQEFHMVMPYTLLENIKTKKEW